MPIPSSGPPFAPLSGARGSAGSRRARGQGRAIPRSCPSRRSSRCTSCTGTHRPRPCSDADLARVEPELVGGSLDQKLAGAVARPSSRCHGRARRAACSSPRRPLRIRGSRACRRPASAPQRGTARSGRSRCCTSRRRHSRRCASEGRGSPRRSERELGFDQLLLGLLSRTRFSRRSSTHTTGRPRARAASATATSSGCIGIFCPNPPPTSGTITRIRPSGIPVASASRRRRRCGHWVEAQKVSSPRAASKLAAQPRVSMGTAAWRLPWYRVRTMWSARAKAPSRSPSSE